MERRAFLALPVPSPDHCEWCGFPLARGTHGVFKGGEDGQSVRVNCLVPFDIAYPNAPNAMPTMDVVFGTATITAID